MAPNLKPGIFKIVSLLEGNPPTSVNLTLPAFQSVYLNGPVTTWVVREEGDNIYHLSLGGYPFTGEIDDKVTASIHEEQNLKWRAIYRVAQDAYTIEPVNGGGKGWTVPFEADPRSQAVIELKLIIVQPSEPPRFSTAQLFRFVPVDA